MYVCRRTESGQSIESVLPLSHMLLPSDAVNYESSDTDYEKVFVAAAIDDESYAAAASKKVLFFIIIISTEGFNVA